MHRKDRAAASAEEGVGANLSVPFIIAIDAGHGGEDPGAKGRSGTFEKDVTLAIARKLKARLDHEPGMRGVLIRDGDYFIPLQMRVHEGAQVQADLFVSIHADAFIEARCPRLVGVRAVGTRRHLGRRALARKERERSGPDRRREHRRARPLPEEDAARPVSKPPPSTTVSSSARNGARSSWARSTRCTRQTVEQAGFAVLKAPDIPSILVETAFITNPDEEKRLRNDDATRTRSPKPSSRASSAISRRIPRSRARGGLPKPTSVAATGISRVRCDDGRTPCRESLRLADIDRGLDHRDDGLALRWTADRVDSGTIPLE